MERMTTEVAVLKNNRDVVGRGRVTGGYIHDLEVMPEYRRRGIATGIVTNLVTLGGTYRFGEYPGFTPEYVHHLKDMIHILDNPKMNQIGDEYYALSKNWFERSDEEVEQLKNNVSNCFRNLWGDIPADERLWGSYNGAFAIYAGTLNSKNKTMWQNKTECTNEVLSAAAQYLLQENISMKFDYHGKKYRLCVIEAETSKDNE